MRKLARDLERKVSQIRPEDGGQSLLIKSYIEEGRTLILVTGQSGSGKSYLLDQFIQTPPALHHVVALNADQISSASDVKSLIMEPNLVLVVDDAEELRREVLVELLTIAAYAEHEQEYCAVVLCGSQTLMTRVQRWLEDHENPIKPVCIEVKPLTLSETRKYLQKRFNGECPFGEEQLKRIHQLSGGLPLRINRVAKQTLVDEVKALETDRLTPPKMPVAKPKRLANNWWKAAGFVGLVAIVAVMIILAPYFNSKKPQQKLAEVTTPQPTQQLTQTSMIDPAPQTIELTRYTLPSLAAITPVPENPAVKALLPQVDNNQAAKESVSVVAEQNSPINNAIVEVMANDIPKPVVSYTQDEQQLLQMQGYTLQLMGVHYLPTLTKVVQRFSIADDTRIFRTEFMEQEWFVLTLGHYFTIKEAQEALATLPAEMKILKPWIRPLNDIQVAIRQHQKSSAFANVNLESED